MTHNKFSTSFVALFGPQMIPHNKLSTLLPNCWLVLGANQSNIKTNLVPTVGTDLGSWWDPPRI